LVNYWDHTEMHGQQNIKLLTQQTSKMSLISVPFRFCSGRLTNFRNS